MSEHDTKPHRQDNTTVSAGTKNAVDSSRTDTVAPAPATENNGIENNTIGSEPSKSTSPSTRSLSAPSAPKTPKKKIEKNMAHNLGKDLAKSVLGGGLAGGGARAVMSDDKLPNILASNGGFTGAGIRNSSMEGLGGPTGGFAGPLGGASAVPNGGRTGGFAGPLGPSPQVAPTGGASSGRPPEANEPWFTITLNGDNSFGVYSFSGHEQVSSCYEFTVQLVHVSPNVDINSFIGNVASLHLADRGGGRRIVHGLVREFVQQHTANKFTHYTCIIVPRFWFLNETRDHRIFQEKNVIDIITQLLEEQGFAGDAVSMKCNKTYQPREYCVQYDESDLHFISRLAEEEGIYYYFDHSEDKHTLCFCDMPGGPPIGGEPNVRFYAGSGQMADEAVIARLHYVNLSHSNKSTYRDWNFTKPKLDLQAQLEEGDIKKAPIPGGIDFDMYTYPHLYQLKAEGERYADLQLQRQLCLNRLIDCETDIVRFIPSYTFTLQQHPRSELNEKWWILSVTHMGEQPAVLGHETPDRGMLYASKITAIPNNIQYIPAVRHSKGLIVGQQTAIVTGPEGEEIYPDKYGRVKVQFFWDREGEWNEKTTCWIRVSQGWAGSQYGTMAIPRIGHEVIVSFLEGNPDRPIITGRVYHALNMPPYELPANKTRTVFKSMSTPGEENEARGFNELRIEDKKGEEEIYVHAEKDVNVYVKNDWKEHILHDKHETIDNYTYLETKGETHETLHGQRKTELHANDNLTIHATRHEKIDEKWLVKVGDEVHIKAGAKVVIEAGAELTLKAGGAFIKLDASGMTANGSKINLNSGGSPGSGSGSDPSLPAESLTFIVSDAPESQALALINAARDGQPFCAIC